MYLGYSWEGCITTALGTSIMQEYLVKSWSLEQDTFLGQPEEAFVDL